MTETTTPAPQRTEETMPGEIRCLIRALKDASFNVGVFDAPEHIERWNEEHKREDVATAALESAITSALGVQADRIAELEAKVGTLTVALEMSRTSLGDAQRRARAEALEEAAKVCDELDAEAELKALRCDNRDRELACEYRAEGWAHHKAAQRIRALSSKEG